MRQPIAASVGSSSSAATARAQRGGVGELGIVVDAEDDTAMAKRRTAIAAAGNAVVVVKRHQRCVLSSGDHGGEPREVLGPRTLIDNEDMTRHAGLFERRVDRRHGLLGSVERQDHHIGVVIAVRRTGCAGDMTRCHWLAANRWDRQVGQPLQLLPPARDLFEHEAADERQRGSQYQSGCQQCRGQPRHHAGVQKLQHDRQAESETDDEQCRLQSTRTTGTGAPASPVS